MDLEADRLFKLAEDPIDLNFMDIAQPVVPEVPQVTAGEGFTEREAAIANALDNNLAHQIALSDALLTSLNRAQGARLLGNEEWEAKQLRTVRRYAAQLAKLLKIELRLLADAAKIFRAAGFVSQPVTAEDVREVQDDIATHGFTADEIEVLEQLGV